MKSYVRKVVNLGNGTKLVSVFEPGEFLRAPHSWLGVFFYPAKLLIWLWFQLTMLAIRIALLPILLLFELIKWCWGKNKLVAIAIVVALFVALVLLSPLLPSVE